MLSAFLPESSNLAAHDSRITSATTKRRAGRLYTAEDEKVVEYLEHHVKVPPRKIEKPLKTSNMVDLVGEWDAKFADTDQDVMFKTLLVSGCKWLKGVDAAQGVWKG